MGRRIEVTVANNLLALNAERDFLTPFRERKQKEGYVGLGKLIDAAVRFAAYTADPRVVEFKQRLVAEAIRTQEADGYLGILKPEHRVSALWDVHELGYLAYALAIDHRFFDEPSSLAAARKLADYVIAHWPAQPQQAIGGEWIKLHVSVTGVETAFLALYEQRRTRGTWTSYRKHASCPVGTPASSGAAGRGSRGMPTLTCAGAWHRCGCIASSPTRDCSSPRTRWLTS